jgi:gluconate kinase
MICKKIEMRVQKAKAQFMKTSLAKAQFMKIRLSKHVKDLTPCRP